MGCFFVLRFCYEIDDKKQRNGLQLHVTPEPIYLRQESIAC